MSDDRSQKRIIGIHTRSKSFIHTPWTYWYESTYREQIVSVRTFYIKKMQAMLRNRQHKKSTGRPRLTKRREDRILHYLVRSNYQLYCCEINGVAICICGLVNKLSTRDCWTVATEVENMFVDLDWPVSTKSNEYWCQAMTPCCFTNKSWFR